MRCLGQTHSCKRHWIWLIAASRNWSKSQPVRKTRRFRCEPTSFESQILYDVKDIAEKWWESSIRAIKDDRIFIHYNGWPMKWDEWLPIDSERLAAPHTHTTGPRRYKRRWWHSHFETFDRYDLAYHCDKSKWTEGSPVKASASPESLPQFAIAFTCALHWLSIVMIGFTLTAILSSKRRLSLIKDTRTMNL